MRRYVFVRVSLKRRDGNARDLSRWGRDERAPRPRAPQRGPRTSFEDVTSLERSIHLGLELPEQVDRDVVVEREDLREEDATDALGAVDPEVGVCEPGPRQTAGRAAGRRLLGVEQKAQAPLLGHSGKELDVVGQRRDRGFECADLECADVVLRHEGDGFGAQEPGAFEAAVVHDHLRESQVVGGGPVLGDRWRPDLVAESRRVGQEVTQRDRPLGLPEARLAGGVEALEHFRGGDFRDDLARRTLETELAPLDELHRRRGGDRFGHRRDPDHRVECHWRVLTELPLAEGALVENSPVAGGDCDDAWHGLRRNGLAEDRVDALEVWHWSISFWMRRSPTAEPRWLRQLVLPRHEVGDSL